MKKLMIVGASQLQLPAIRRAKELGYCVAVADYDPTAVGIPFADEYFNVSTIDEAGVCEATRKFGAHGIMTLATDMPMRSVAYTCEQLGLPGITYQTALKATDKGEMIRAFEAHGVAHPRYRIISQPWQWETIREEVSYPCISKPTDNAGSRGVTLIRGEDELQQAIAYSSRNGRSGTVIIEEYMRGQEVSVEIVVCHGVVHILQITDKLTTGAPHFVEMGHSQPSRLCAPDLLAIRDLATRAVAAIGIDNSPAHVEIMLTEDGPKMVELGARMGGDCITTHLVPLSTGIDMIRATMAISLGEEPDLTPKWERGAAIRYFRAPAGEISAIRHPESAQTIPGIREITFTKNIGEMSGDIGSSTDRIGYVIAQAEDAEKAVQACEQALQTVHISVKNPTEK